MAAKPSAHNPLADAVTERPIDPDAMSDGALLRAFLASRDIGCPACGYNLCSIKSAKCPECGAALHLTLATSARRANPFWMLGFFPLAAATGMPLVLVLGMTYDALMMPNAWGRGEGTAFLWSLALVLGLVACIWVLRRCGQSSVSRSTGFRITAVMVCWAVAVLATFAYVVILVP